MGINNLDNERKIGIMTLGSIRIYMYTIIEEVMTMMYALKRSTRKSGHSVITTLPPDVMSKLELVSGDNVEFVIKDNVVELRKAAEKKEAVSQDFLKMAEEVLEEYDQAFRGLVDR